MTGAMRFNTSDPGFGTVMEWRAAARRYGCRSYREAARRHARQHGRAVVMLADDSVLVTRRDDSRARGVSERTHKARAVVWIHDDAAGDLPPDLPPELA